METPNNPEQATKKPPRKKRRSTKLILAAAVLLAGMLVDSNFRLTITRYTASTPRLPAAFNGFKIITLSDQHGMLFGKGDGRLLDKIRAENPDIITVTGDFISYARDLPAAQIMLAGLTAIAPVYCCTGNHDWGSGQIHSLADIFAKTGAICLHNDYVTLEKNGNTIILAGVEDPNSWAEMERPDELINRIRKSYPTEYVILLGHRNYWADVYPDLDADLILCGHGHGGIIRLPFINGVIDVNRSFFPKYAGGLYESGSYQMIVSRGLGQVPLIPRFMNNPEIVVVTLDGGR